MNTDHNDIISLHDIVKFFILNGRKLLILWLIFLILCIAVVHWTYQTRKMFYVSVSVPFSYYKSSNTIQTDFLIDKLQLKETMEWIYLPKFRKSIANNENRALIDSIRITNLSKDKKEDNGKLIVLMQGVYLEKNEKIEHLLSNFTAFIKASVNQITSPLKSSIQNQIDTTKHRYEELLKKTSLEMESKLQTIKEHHIQELEAWKSSLSFQQHQQKEIESMIARIEKLIINDSKENNMYFLLKQDFLYKKLYDIQRETFLLQEKIKNADANLALQIDDIQRQNKLSVNQINSQYQLKLTHFEAELKMINKTQVIYYFSNQTQGLSLSALYLLSLLLSLILAVVSTYIISLFTTVKKGIH